MWHTGLSSEKLETHVKSREGNYPVYCLEKGLYATYRFFIRNIPMVFFAGFCGIQGLNRDTGSSTYLLLVFKKLSLDPVSAKKYLTNFFQKCGLQVFVGELQICHDRFGRGRLFFLLISSR